MRPATVESRFDALHATGLTELVGREEELEMLLRRWSKAKSGEGQVVLLSGEPGIGQVSIDGCAYGAPRHRTTHSVALLLLPTAHRQRPPILSLVKWSALLALHTKTPRKRSSTN